MSMGDTIAAIRDQGGLVYLPHPFDRLHSIPDAADAPPPPRRDRRLRGLQRAAPLRRLQRRGAALRAQVQPAHGRRLRRARAPGRRHRAACACARSRPRRSSSSASARPRSCAGPKSLALPPEPQVGRAGARAPGEGARPGRKRTGSPNSSMRARGHQRHLRPVPEEGDRRDQRARRASSPGRPGRDRAPVLGSGHPLADVFLLKYGPQASELHEGVAFFGRTGQAILKSLQRLRVDPTAIYGTNCIKFEERPRRRRAPFVTRELHVVQPKLVVVDGRGRAHVPERRAASRSPTRSRTDRASSSASRRRSRRSSRPTSTRRSTSSRRSARSGRRSRRSAPGGQSFRPTSARRRPRRVTTCSRSGCPSSPLWWDVALLGVVLSPATFALVWLALPLRRVALRSCSVGASRLAASPRCSSWQDPDIAANFAKLAAIDGARLVLPALLRGGELDRCSSPCSSSRSTSSPSRAARRR